MHVMFVAALETRPKTAIALGTVAGIFCMIILGN